MLKWIWTGQVAKRTDTRQTGGDSYKLIYFFNFVKGIETIEKIKSVLQAIKTTKTEEDTEIEKCK